MKIEQITHIIEPNYSTHETINATYSVCLNVIERGIIGDFIECGVASGNNFAAMVAANYWNNKQFIIRDCIGYDSFEGIPWAGDNDDQQPGIGEINKDKLNVLESSGISSHSREDVITNMKRWNLSNYFLKKGWFQDTIVKYDRPVAVLRLDGDLYESTRIPLNVFGPNVPIGGYIIIDDWNLSGARKAWEEWPQKNDFEDQNINPNDNPKYFKRVNNSNSKHTGKKPATKRINRRTKKAN